MRKSRERAKLRHEDTQTKLIELAKENNCQKALIGTIKGDYDKLESKMNLANQRLEDMLRLNVRLRQFISNLPVEYQPKFSF